MSAQGANPRNAMEEFEQAVQDATVALEQFTQRAGQAGGVGGTGGVGAQGGGAGRPRGVSAGGAVALGFVGARLAGLGRRVGRNTASFVGADVLRNQTSASDSLLNAGVRAFDPLGLNQDVTGAQDAALRRTAGVLVPLARSGVNVSEEARQNLYRFFGAQEVRGQQELRELRRVSSENLAQFTGLNPLTTGIFGQTIQGVFRATGLAN